MKTFVLVSGDLTTHRGMDCANFHLARYLACDRGFAVHLVAFHVEQSLAESPNVTWHRVSKLLNSYTLSERRLDHAGRAVARSLPRARVIVNGGNCDAADVNWVHYVHAAWSAKASGSLAFRLRRQLQHQAHLRRERRIIPKAKWVIANSERTRNDLIERVGVQPDRIKTVYYGIDPSRFSPATSQTRAAMRRHLELDDRAPIAAFVGALGDLRKGFDLLSDAWRQLASSSGWDVTLLVIGQGAQARHWQAEVDRCNLGHAIRFLGFRSDVPDVLKACDLLISPTRYEAYGLGVHEALCCGVPAIVSASAGVAERLPAELATSLLIPEPLSVATLVQRLRHWRANMAQSASEILALSQKLRNLSWDAMSREILEWIEPELARNAPPSDASLSIAKALP